METQENTKLNKRVIFADNFSLLLKLIPPHFKKSYGYVLTIKNEEQENSLKYEVDITYIKTIPEKARLFRIERTSEVYVNDMVPDMLIDKLANQAGSVLYPMIIEADFNGRFLAIHNYKEITERWETIKPEIKEYFVGEIAEKYCKLMDTTIASEDLLNRSIQKDFLISTYFAPIYKSYTNQLQIEEQATYPLAGPAAPVAFNVTQKILQYISVLDAVELQHGGKSIDERGIADIEQEHSFPFDPTINQPFSGEYMARYLLHDQTKAIRSINAQWVLDLTSKRTITVSMHETIKDPENMVSNNQQKPGLVFIDKDESHHNIFTGIWKSLFG